MTRSKEPRTPKGEYEVGYGRPPQAARFQPGRSGNPAGRRKAPKSVGVLLQEALATRVTVQENGQPRRLTVQEVIIRGLVNDAARRDHRALRVLLLLMERYQNTMDPNVDPAHFQPEDQAIIEDYLAQRLATGARSDRQQADGNADEASQDESQSAALPDADEAP
jgi:hypothetical protein